MVGSSISQQIMNTNLILIPSTRAHYFHGKIVHENHTTQHTVIQFQILVHVHHSFVKKEENYGKKTNGIKEFPLPNHAIYTNIMSNPPLP